MRYTNALAIASQLKNSIIIHLANIFKACVLERAWKDYYKVVVH